MTTSRTARTLARYKAWAEKQIFQVVAALPPGEAEKPRQSIFKSMIHTLHHTSYHRGFVAQMIYEVPSRPPTTDVPVFLRDVPQID